MPGLATRRAAFRALHESGCFAIPRTVISDPQGATFSASKFVAKN